ncbi:MULTISPECIES: DNA alkylation repair protein [Clostridium]|uniref:DNA alkylation repair protein n=1 Tax=Clostridium TaxID=1485 RepID=UPI000825FB0A|nr:MULTISPECIES: DNA alkylation repair protein [Clostridium]PJI08995.1 DNA alkylation repair protein [Clostridium sp. CT7]
MDDFNKMVQKQLFDLADEKYRKFSASLLPNVNNILGVRLPELRKLAKKIAKDDWRNFINVSDGKYFEENMLQGMVIGYAKMDIEKRLKYITEFIPKINNWSLCDSFCNGLKFTVDNMEKVFEFIKPYLLSEKEFEVRFAVVMILDFYINEGYINEILKLFDTVKHSGYYAKMAVAWAVSICYVKFPSETMEYLKNNTLDDFTYNKALQKITESFRVDKDTKNNIRSMKRAK